MFILLNSAEGVKNDEVPDFVNHITLHILNNNEKSTRKKDKCLLKYRLELIPYTIFWYNIERRDNEI